MTRPAHPLRALAAVAAASLIGAGCASAPADSGTAAGSATASATGTGAATRATAQDKAVKFAECIRAHDVPHFPDPDPKGDFVFGIDVSPAVWKQAVDACKDLQPPGALSGKRSPKQQSDALRFAGCVRAHGVKDFPDPVNGDPLIDTTKIPSSNAPGGMTILDAATQKCGSILKLAAGGQG